MKTIYLMLLGIITLGCNNQPEGFKIKGTITGLDHLDTAIMFSGSDTLAYATIVDGKFELTGKVDESHGTYLYIQQKGNEKQTSYPVDFIISNDDFEFVGNEAFQYVKGGKINDIVNGYKFTKQFKDAKIKSNQIYHQYFDGLDLAGDKEKVEEARREWKKYYTIPQDISNQYKQNELKKEHNALTKLYLYYGYSNKDFSMEDRLAVYSELESELGSHPIIDGTRKNYEESKKREEMAKSVYVGMDFKEVTGNTVDGDQLKLSEIVKKNEYTLLEFWASWCGPCRGEFPHLKKAYNQYKDKGFEIYALSIDSDQKRWLKALKEDNPPWLRIVDHAAFKSEGIVNYAVYGIPASFLISKEGKVVAMGNEVRGFGLDEKLEELLGK